MMRRYNAEILLFLFFLFSFENIIHAQINVNPNQTASALATKLAGTGVTILNPTLNCSSRANGFFNVVSSNLGLDSGIVLTTGCAATQGNIFGVNGAATNLASNDNGLPGDVSLNPLAQQTTFDACDLEFDLIPNGDTIRFNYVFSSEEYKNAVCGPYNDAFAFFISGPGITGYENMALVPGTNIPVTINTINDGIPGSVGNISNCTRMGAGSPFTAYFIDNAAGTTLTHVGLTTVLQAVHGVTPCSTYHLKIVIADAGDPLYDSGVFLKAGSLQTTNYNVNALIPPTPTADSAFCIKGCLPGLFQVKCTQISSQPQTVKYITGGNAVSGIDYRPLPDSVIIPANDSVAEVVINGLPTLPFGAKTITLYVMSPFLCAGTSNIVDSASLVIYDTLHISIMTPDTVICGSDSVLLQVNSNDPVQYSWSPTTGLSNPNTEDPIAFPSVNTTYEVTASLPGTACPVKTAQVSFAIKLTPDPEALRDINICFNSQIQLNVATTQPNMYYSYHWTGPDGFTSTTADTIIDNAVPQNAGTYVISVVNDTNSCKGSASINVTVNTPDTPVVVSPVIVCLNTQAVVLSAKGDSLLWYDGQGAMASDSAPVPSTNEAGIYSYYVSQKINNCESPKSEIEVEIKRCCDGNIFIPTAFTPNGDGLNDKFEPVTDYGYFLYNMSVYNRWGQMVYNGLQGGWNGDFGGRPVEIGTYFYTITFGCILGGTVVRKGDVTLIR